MNIIKYEVFLKVVEYGSISRVAEDLGYTKSALSKMIDSMEEEIGLPLVTRTRKGINLNEEGKRVLPLIKRLVAEHHALEEEYDAIKGVTRGKLRIGCFPTMAYLLMPDFLKDFKERHPGILIEVVEKNSLPQLESWLKQGIIDAALISKEQHHDFDWFELMEEEYVALIPDKSPLAEQDIISVESMFAHNLILFKTQEGYDQDMMKFQDVTRKKQEEAYNTNSIFFVERMVAFNNCTAIVPLSAARDAALYYPVQYRKLSEEVTRTMGFAVRDKENASLVLREFLQYVKKVLQ